MSLIIVSVLVVLIVSSANLLSISESGMGLQENQGWAAYYLANACAEDALMKLKNDLNYNGNETLIFDNGNCTIELLEGVENENRIIKTLGTAYNQVRKIRIEINRVNPDTEIKTWQEVTIF